MPDTPENMRGTRATHTRDTDTTNNTNTTAQTQANANTPANQSSTQSTSPPNDQTQPSLARRVQNSATGLARSAFQGASSNAAQTLSSATNGKSGSFPSAPSAGYASHVLGSGALSVSPGQSARGSGAREAFRGGQDTSGLSQAQGGFEIPALSGEEFQHMYGSGALGPEQDLEDVSASTGVNTQSSREGLQSSTTGNWKGKQRAQDLIQMEYTTAWERAKNTNAHPEQTEAALHMNPADGAAVVSLLSDTSFDANFGGAYGDQDTYLGADLDPDAAPPPLTAEEIKMLESFRRQIAQEEGGTQLSQAPLSSFSLVPDIDTFLRENDSAAYAPAPTQTDLGRSTSTHLRDAVLSQLPGAEDWVSVHERYHDEVWGYLRPALEAAQKEIEEKTEIGDDGDGPAVRRLKMILKHMKV